MKIEVKQNTIYLIPETDKDIELCSQIQLLDNGDFIIMDKLI
jgi:hypothetical protein